MKKNNGYLTIGVAAGLFTATVVGLSIASYIKSRKRMSKRLSEEDIKSKYLGDSPPLLSSAHSENNKENSTKQEESESSHIPLIEEKLNISKREVTYKEATLIKEPVTETKTFEVPVTHEELIVERRPPTEATTSQDELKSPVTTKEEIKVPLKKEEIEVKKEPYVKEEIVIKKRRVAETKTITEEVKSEKLVDDSRGNDFK